MNTHVYPTRVTLFGVWTIGPKTLRFKSESNTTCIASFHIGPSFHHLHAAIVCGSISSSLLVTDRVILYVKILLTIILFLSNTSLVRT